MKSIIIASDFSNEADAATQYAIAIAKIINVDVVLFHLHTMSVHVANARLTPAALQVSLDHHREKVEKIGRDLATNHQINCEVAWRMGDFYDELQDVISTYSASLVVMGMANKTLEQDLLGNTTTSAINKLKTPVLAIPNGVKFNGIKNILFACDIDRGIHAQVLKQVKTLANAFNASVEVFYVSKELSHIEKKANDPALVKSFGDELNGIQYYYKNVASNSVLQAIEDEISEIKADLLIMVPNKYGFWGSLVHKSKTRAMAAGNSIPLLSIPI